MELTLDNPYRFGVVESWLGFFNGLEDELRLDRPAISQARPARVPLRRRSRTRSPTRARTRRSPPQLRAEGADAPQRRVPGRTQPRNGPGPPPAMLTFAGRSLAAGTRAPAGHARADRRRRVALRRVSRHAAGRPAGALGAGAVGAFAVGALAGGSWRRRDGDRPPGDRRAGRRAPCAQAARGGEVVLDSLEVGALKVGALTVDAHRRSERARDWLPASNIVGAFGETTTEVPMASVGSDIRNVEVTDEELWQDGPPHESFKRMRAECPVHWTEHDRRVPGGGRLLVGHDGRGRPHGQPRLADLLLRTRAASPPPGCSRSS